MAEVSYYYTAYIFKSANGMGSISVTKKLKPCISFFAAKLQTSYNLQRLCTRNALK